MYAIARPAYPQELFTNILSKLSHKTDDIYLDLGCGTGELLVPLAQHFKHCFGVDPDAAMLDEAAKKLQTIEKANVSLIKSTSEEYFSSLPTTTKLSLVTAGRALPWMNQQLVIQGVYNRLDKGGMLAIVMDAGGSFWKTDTIWFNAVRPIIFESFTHKKPFVPIKGINMSLDVIKSNVKSFPFEAIENFEISMQKEWDIQSIINLFYSGTGFLDWLAADKEEFEHRVKKTLLAMRPDGVFVDTVTFEVIFCVK